MTVRPSFAERYTDWNEVDVWLHRQIFDGECPEPVMTLSEWADRYRILPTEAAAEPGQWRTSRTPYLREIMDAASPSSAVQEIVFAKSAQVGGTECALNLIGFIIDYAPGPAILVQPTELMVKRNSRQRIQPMIDATPRLVEKVGKAKTRDSGNSVLEKHFPGGMLSMVGANSPASLRSMPARYVLLDEVDAYKHDLADEGHPCELAKARAVTYFRRGIGKMFEISTPLIRDQSRIEARFKVSDQRFYQLPCPHCGGLQGLAFSGRDGDLRPARCALLTWDDVEVPGKGFRADPATAHFLCIDCGGRITEEHKEDMLAAGEWIPENPGAKVRGYHIWAAYSPWVSWVTLVETWHASQGNIELLKTFVNTMLGQTWQERGDAPSFSAMLSQVDDTLSPLMIPAGVLAMTGGIDVQQNRLEYQVVGWNRKLRQRWIIEHGIVHGSPLEDATWDALDAVLVRSYDHELGGQIGVGRWAIDCNAFTDSVYSYVYTRHNVNFISPVRGGSETNAALVNAGKDVDVTVKRQGRTFLKALRVWTLGVSQLKLGLYERLNKQIEKSDDPEVERFCHFPASFGDHEMQSLLSESLVREKDKRGQTKTHWSKHYERNEVLDCHIYATAASLLARMNLWPDSEWDKLERAGAPKAPSWSPPAKRAARPSRYTTGAWRGR